ncbi:sensor histidine kinase [Streptomyces humi]|uniref:sensor histidine kinase n=1 Tax=Streptomyces humi TaxID=1428620 RepID=UPI0019D1AB22|nr:histidine kinase [Streptomyces humi]
MEHSSGEPDDEFADGARSELSPRTVRALWWGSAGLVLGVLGTSVAVAGTEHGGRLPVAVALVLAQVCALRWLVRAPVAVLAATALTGLAVWALLPAVSLTGALLGAQLALCVLSAVMPRRVSLAALVAMCLPAPLAFGAGGPAGLAVFVLTVVLAWTAGQWRRAQRARTRAETRRAVLEERARIAREVHDVVAHTLSVVVVQAGAADDVFTERPDQARQALRAIETGARSALGELRLLLRAFGPDAEAPQDGAGQRTPSLARLDELADAVRAAGLAVRMSREGPLDGLPAAVDLAAYRIVQEALTNALRHAAGADEVRVRVVADGAGVRVTVVDNGRTRPGVSVGRGRPDETVSAGAAPKGAGHGVAGARRGVVGAGRGVVGMRERARLVGGSLRAGPLPGGGFEVAARLPVEDAS